MSVNSKFSSPTFVGERQRISWVKKKKKKKKNNPQRAGGVTPLVDMRP
jgi:hypothetical protein